MSITSGRLLANCCCIYMLLLSVASTTTAKPTKATPTTAANKEALEGESSHNLSPVKDKCQYNLLDSSHSLEAESSIYQHQGFSQCEFIIKAPSGRFILLNFTNIHSQSDMPVEIGVRRQHLQQAATQTTTTLTPSLASANPRLTRPSTQTEGDEKASQNSLQLKTIAEQVKKDTNSPFGQPDFLTNATTDKRKSSIGEGGSGRSAGDLENFANETVSKETYREAVRSGSSVKSGASSHNSYSDSEEDKLNGEDFELSNVSRRVNPQDVDAGWDLQVPEFRCSLKLIIEEVNSSSGSPPQVICWRASWRQRIPLVYQYSVPIKITYKWNLHSQSGFSLDFSFLKPEEFDCLFRCNSHLCLPETLLCDGFVDCPDQSDEHRSACSLVRQQQTDDEPYVMKAVVIVISVILPLALVIAVILMINRIRCRNGARQGRDSLLQPPHSQSSEVCRSTSGSMQDNGQCQALLHERQHSDPQRQLPAMAVTVASRNDMEHHQLLHQSHRHDLVDQHQRQMGQQRSRSQQQQQQQHSLGHEYQMSPPALGTDGTLDAENARITRSMQQQQQQKQHAKQQHLQQQSQLQRHHKQSRKHANPNEFFPPHIPVSGDGEEGYAMAQKALHSKQQLERNWQVENDVVRPPPNRTIFDRDSPPPPYSFDPPGTKSLDSLVPSVEVANVLRPARSSVTPQGSPTGVSQSHSLSCHH